MSENIIITITIGGFIATVIKNGKEQKGFGKTKDLAIVRAFNEGYSFSFGVIGDKPARNKISPKTVYKATPTSRNGGIYLSDRDIREIGGFQYANLHYRYFCKFGFVPKSIKNSEAGRGRKYNLTDLLTGLRLCEERGFLKSRPQKESFKKYIEKIENYLEELKICQCTKTNCI